jgi:hypothetical protein
VCYQAVTSYAGHLTPQLRCCAPSQGPGSATRPPFGPATMIQAQHVSLPLRIQYRLGGKGISPFQVSSAGRERHRCVRAVSRDREARGSRENEGAQRAELARRGLGARRCGNPSP